MNARRMESAERDGRANALAGLHLREGVVDVVDLDDLRDHALEVELAGLPEAEQAGEVAAHVGRAVEAALEVLLAVEDLEGGERHLFVHPADAHDAGGAPPPGPRPGR